MNLGDNVIDHAKALIGGDRREQYGPPQESFNQIAELWSTVLGVEVAPWQVAICMTQLKIVRLCNDPENMDSWVDIIGYAALGAELALTEQLEDE